MGSGLKWYMDLAFAVLTELSNVVKLQMQRISNKKVLRLFVFLVYSPASRDYLWSNLPGFTSTTIGQLCMDSGSGCCGEE